MMFLCITEVRIVICTKASQIGSGTNYQLYMDIRIDMH